MDFNLFKSKKENKHALNLIFTINSDKVNTSFIYKDKKPENAQKIAGIIYALNSGMLFDSMIDSLVDQGQKGDKDFIVAILNELNKYYSADSRNDLIIYPLETFTKYAK